MNEQKLYCQEPKPAVHESDDAEFGCDINPATMLRIDPLPTNLTGSAVML